MAGWESHKVKVHAIAAVARTAAASTVASALIGAVAKLIQGGGIDVAATVAALLGSQPSGSDVTLYDFDVLQYADSWELNGIPSAALQLAVGRRADMAGDPAGVATIHNAIDQLKMQVPVVVYAKGRSISSEQTPSLTWPVDGAGAPAEFVLFRGYAVGGGFNRAFGDARYGMALTHWLADMSFSSAISRTTHPITPNAYFAPAAFNFTNGEGGAGILSASYTGPGMALKFFQATEIAADFWGGRNPAEHITQSFADNGGLKSWFTALSSQDRINVQEINAGVLALGGVDCLIPRPGANAEALEALARFEPYATGTLGVALDARGYRMGVPLSLDLKGASGAMTANNIGMEVGKETLDTSSNYTLWDKLAGQFHANYLYSVVPTVETALVVPFIPGLRGPAHRDIFATEYGSISSNINLPRPLRGVAVLMGRAWAAGANIGVEPGPDYKSIGGWYGVCRDGMIHFKDAPTWLQSVAPGFWTRGTSPVGEIPTAAGGGRPFVGPLPPPPPPREVLKAAKPLWDAYAQALYVHEVLKQRQGQLSGRPRFDLAPGSLVCIEASEDEFVDALRGQRDSMWMWATVLRVSTTIDAESSRASTGLHLAHLRSDVENNSNDTSIARHPLWLDTWSGCSLVDDEAFAPVVTRSAQR